MNRTVGQNEAHATPLGAVTFDSDGQFRVSGCNPTNEDKHEIARRANAYPRLVISVENSVAIIGMLLDHVPLAQRAALLACMNERRALLSELEEGARSHGARV
ncbi:MAG: hypothetical protein Q8P46_15645 [Hyphomicrobiales bacterium]|nr:hypothetical protein [Hyphomicrobiales bacterium]